MLIAACEQANAIGAELIVTGEVLGQRATNQSRRQIDLLTYHSGANDKLFRPLSAKLLGAPPQIRELGIEKVSQAISGSGRRPIRELAKNLGIVDSDRPAPQCRLSDPGYMARLDDLLVHQAEIDFAEIDLLRLGRHYRLHRTAKAIVGRNAADNDAIAEWFANHSIGRLFVPSNFQGASVLLVGDSGDDIETVLSLSAGRKNEMPPDGFQFREGERLVTLSAVQAVDHLTPIQAG
jgi:tRNA-uridine 2-sulfurtransferase